MRGEKLKTLHIHDRGFSPSAGVLERSMQQRGELGKRRREGQKVNRMIEMGKVTFHDKHNPVIYGR